MGLVIKRYIWILSLFFVLVLSYILARTTALVISGYFPEENFAASFTNQNPSLLQNQAKSVPIDDIINRNFFDALESTFENTATTETIEEVAEPDLPVQTTGVAVKTGLSITLVSTVAFGNGEDPMSSCVLLANNQTEVYGVGDNLGFPQTKLVRIQPKRIEFSNKGRLEYVEISDEEAVKTTSPVEVTSVASLEPASEDTEPTEEDAEDAGGVEQDGNHFKVKAALVQEAMSQPDKLYSQVRAIPYTENGKNAGFKFFKVSNKSIFHQLGIRRGDVVKTVNGKTLDMQSGMQTFSELKNLKNFEIDLSRKGTDQKFTYEVVD